MAKKKPAKSLIGKYAIGKLTANSRYSITKAGTISKVVPTPDSLHRYERDANHVAIQLLYSPHMGGVGTIYAVESTYFYFVDKVPRKYSLQVSLAQMIRHE